LRLVNFTSDEIAPLRSSSWWWSCGGVVVVVNLKKALPGPNGCWLWPGGLNQEGYGQKTIDGKTYKAHRLIYELLIGPIPDGFEVCHSCDRPRCVNPEHLFLGTHADNMRDKVEKGRARGGKGKLTPSKVVEIKERLAAGETKLGLAREYNVDRKTLRKIAAGEIWRKVA
jgi:hypothetical protein